MNERHICLFIVDLLDSLTRRAAIALAMALYRVSCALVRFARPGPDPVWEIISIRRKPAEKPARAANYLDLN